MELNARRSSLSILARQLLLHLYARSLMEFLLRVRGNVGLA
jgi:hypothetical protein